MANYSTSFDRRQRQVLLGVLRTYKTHLLLNPSFSANGMESKPPRLDEIVILVDEITNLECETDEDEEIGEVDTHLEERAAAPHWGDDSPERSSDEWGHD